MSRLSSFRRQLGVAVLCCAVTAPAFAQSEDARVGARAAATAGATAFNEKRWADAVDLFTRAESLVHAPTHLLYTARAYVHLGKLVEAREIYLRITREQLAPKAPEAFVDAQKSAATELAALEPRLPYVTINVHGAGAEQITLTQDDDVVPSVLIGIPRPVDPGDHTFVAKTATKSSTPMKVHAEEGKRTSIALELVAGQAAAAAAPVAAPPGSSTAAGAPSAAPATGNPDQGPPAAEHGNSTLKYLSIASFGLGAVGIAGGIVFTLKASSKQSDSDNLFNACNAKPPCTAAQKADISSFDSDAKSARTLGTVGFIVGGVGIAGGITLLIMSGNKKSSSTASNAPHMTPWVGLQSAGVTGTF